MSTTKVRVYELAREVGLDNKEVLRRLEELDIDASTHSSSVTAGEAQRFRESLGKSEEQRRLEEEERRRREQEELDRYRKMAEEVTTEKKKSGQKAKAVLPPHLREQQEQQEAAAAEAAAEEAAADASAAAEAAQEEATSESVPAQAEAAAQTTAAAEAQTQATTAGAETAEDTSATTSGTGTSGTATSETARSGATTSGTGAETTSEPAESGAKRMPGAPPPQHGKGDVPLRPQVRKKSEQAEPPPTVTGEGPERRRRHDTSMPKEGSGKRSIPKPIRKAPPRPERPSKSDKSESEDSKYKEPVEAGSQQDGGPDADGARPGENRPSSGKRHRHEKTAPEERYLERKPRRDAPLEEQVIADRVEIQSGITVAELADELDVAGAALVKKLFDMGEMVTVQQTLPDDTVEILGAELGFDVYFMSQAEAEFGVEGPEDPEELVTRPPVITVMGHVDHGKTQLLDAIRKTDVLSSEEGGITQHIGAYQISHDGAQLTFIDTPGHEAFTAMRARGADVTDLVVLVVAADDGVMPQTVEAINHARAAGVPIVVAINKMDLEGADPDKVKGQLTEHELVAEGYGGETSMVQVSALTHEGLDDLVEMLSLQAELLELKANPDKDARGRVVEAHLDTGRGPTATVLIQDGTLRRGDVLVAGATDGKVRAMFDENGTQVDEAGPSKPVQLLGLDDVPEAGDQFRVVDEERFARDVAERRAERERRKELAAQRRPMTLEELTQEVAEGDKEELNVIVKADVSGSAEALQDALDAMEFEEVRISVVHNGVGAVTESDVRLAETFDALIIGFNVRPGSKARDEIERAGVEVRTYSIIYEALEDIQNAVSGLVAPGEEERVLGEVEVRELFKVPDIGFVFGCYVTDGEIRRDAQVRVVRDGVVVAEDRIDSLKRFEDDVREVSEGYECGIGLRRFQDVKVGDVLEIFETVEVERDVTPV